MGAKRRPEHLTGPFSSKWAWADVLCVFSQAGFGVQLEKANLFMGFGVIWAQFLARVLVVHYHCTCTTLSSRGDGYQLGLVQDLCQFFVFLEELEGVIFISVMKDRTESDSSLETNEELIKLISNALLLSAKKEPKGEDEVAPIN